MFNTDYNRIKKSLNSNAEKDLIEAPLTNNYHKTDYSNNMYDNLNKNLDKNKNKNKNKNRNRYRNRNRNKNRYLNKNTDSFNIINQGLRGFNNVPKKTKELLKQSKRNI